ncbi:hypothetical protein McpSp1_09970 [Methanocorpusculaceae archaeon Sp1]|uniref:Uncharacterized protein n=1 Tax=Methanorbis furvi TaxID=3028299 RepID=A0AAE4MEN7_9EURY|nr:hypothetical protein [Methanocorpusculaceae archaeon Sp1]MDV0442373.1 hypothetical protein [Methanocorpusculaceae archaeon Ag1]
MRIKFTDIHEGSDTGAGVEGRKSKIKSAKVGETEESKKKTLGGQIKVIEGEGIPGKANRN